MTKNKSLGIRVDDELRYKIRYIADYDGRSVNNLVMRLIQQCIRDFETENGPIPVPDEKAD